MTTRPKIPKASSLTLRLTLSAGLWCVVALLLSGSLLLSLFRNQAEAEFDQRLSVLLDGLMAAAEIDANGQIHLQRPPSDARYDRVYSGLYWQVIPGKGDDLRSRSLWDGSLPVSAATDIGSLVSYDGLGPNQETLRLAARSVTFEGNAMAFQFIVAADRQEIEMRLDALMQTLVWSFIALGIGLVMAVVLQIRYGLRPLKAIGADIQRIRNGELAQLDHAAPTEIQPLINEINGLLDHNKGLVERARTHAGNLAHALKTPLSILLNESQQTRPVPPTKIRQQVEAMKGHIDHQLRRARSTAGMRFPSARTPVLPHLQSLVRTLDKLYQSRAAQASAGKQAQITCGDDLAVRVEGNDVDEIFGNILDNAYKWAQRQIWVRASGTETDIIVVIEDDGPGMPGDRRDTALGRGVRLDEAVPGSGLGLSIAAELIDLYRGTIALSESPHGGLCVTVSLPEAKLNKR